MRRFALLAFGLLGLLALYLYGYQGPKDESLTVIIINAGGSAMPDINVNLIKEGRLLAQMKTGADGRASIRVVGGPLTASVHQPGYIPVEQPVDTRSLSGHALEITLIPVPRVQETVNVQAANEDITEQTPSPGESIKPQEANENPLRPLTLSDALPLVPGVVLGPNSQIQIEGAGEMHSALVVDSVDTVDPATGRFGLSVPIDVVDSLHVLTSPYLAQYGHFTAGVVTAETRSGGSKWRYDLNDPLPEFRIRSGHLRGLKSATPRLSFGGPIVADRVSFSEGLEFVDNKAEVITLPFPFNETKTTSINSFTQVDFTLSPRQSLTASFHAAPQNVRYANLDFFNLQSVTPNNDTRTYTGAFTHRIALGKGLVQSTLSLNDIATTVSPQSNLGMVVTPAGNSGNYFANQQRQSRRFEWNELWSPKAVAGLGTHKIQIGSFFANASDQGQMSAKTVTLLDDQGVKLRTIGFIGGSPFNSHDHEPAIFVQDHWSLSSHLAVDAGIRAEKQTITTTTRFAPRIGLIWNPSAGGDTAITGGVGVFYDSVPLNVYAFNHYPEQTITTYQPDGTVLGVPQIYLNLTSEAVASGFPFVDSDHKIGNFAPYTIAWNLQVQHKFSERLTTRAKYLENHGNNMITIAPEVIQGQNAFVLAGSGNSIYRQFELTAQLTLQPNNRVYASYVHSLSQGPLNESDTYLGDFASPFIQSNLYGNRPEDLPNRFLTWGSVALPSKIKVYPKIEWRSGFPYQSFDVYQNYVRTSTAENARFPMYFSSDVRVAKDIKMNSKYSVRPSISITNITNHFNVLQIHANTADSQYGQFFGSYNRRVRVDFDLVF